MQNTYLSVWVSMFLGGHFEISHLDLIKPSFGDFYSKSYLDSPTPVKYCALIWRLLEIILIQKINK